MTETATEPRITPLEPPYDAETQAQLEKWMPPGAPVDPLALFRTLLVHPELAARMRPLGSALLGHGMVDRRDREILVLRTCARCGAEYEWGVHAVAFGQAVGLTEEQIAATTLDTTDDRTWSETDRLLLALADELYETDRITDALWGELVATWSREYLLELIVTAGWYRTLSYVINAARIQHEPWAAHFPAHE
jgi:alkylhydroperoxidase/carboxymuconolactone decarboxylase family protein YurZ